eukprot:COSAG06_NODE_6991_length_2684_cov_390.096712_1_plen_173_part_10
MDAEAVEGGKKRRSSTRLPDDLHPPDCERWLYVLDRRHRAYISTNDIDAPHQQQDNDKDDDVEGGLLHQHDSGGGMSGSELLDRARDASQFVDFFRGLLARVGLSSGASAAASICAADDAIGAGGGGKSQQQKQQQGQEGSELSVVEHIAALLAESMALQTPLAIPFPSPAAS